MILNLFIHHFCQSQTKKVREQDKLKTSKNLIQAKLTALYGSIPREINRTFRKDKFSDDCIVIEKSNLSRKSPKSRSVHTFSKDEEEDTVIAATKWLRRETVSPRTEIVKSPSCADDDANTSSNGFVTAKAKLVRCFLFQIYDAKF